MDWRHVAACRDSDPETFFPGTGDEQRALKVCRSCPVADDCLAWAVETGQEHGVWGGRTEAERRALYGPVRQHPADTEERPGRARAGAAAANARHRALRGAA